MDDRRAALVLAGFLMSSSLSAGVHVRVYVPAPPPAPVVEVVGVAPSPHHVWIAGYHRWDVYYRTTSGDVLLPVGYASASPIPADDYLADHPQ